MAGGGLRVGGIRRIEQLIAKVVDVGHAHHRGSEQLGRPILINRTTWYAPVAEIVS